MRTELKEGIFIEGFDEKIHLNLTCDVYFEDTHNILYKGKTSDIPEEVAKEGVKNWRTDGLYNNYKIESQYEEYLFKTAKQSIQSACDKEYCIIYKELKP